MNSSVIHETKLNVVDVAAAPGLRPATGPRYRGAARVAVLPAGAVQPLAGTADQRPALPALPAGRRRQVVRRPFQVIILLC